MCVSPDIQAAQFQSIFHATFQSNKNRRASVRLNMRLLAGRQHTEYLRDLTMWVFGEQDDWSVPPCSKAMSSAYRVNDVCVITIAPSAYMMVLPGHKNVTWWLADNSAEAPSFRSDFRHKLDLPAVWSWSTFYET